MVYAGLHQCSQAVKELTEASWLGSVYKFSMHHYSIAHCFNQPSRKTCCSSSSGNTNSKTVAGIHMWFITNASVPLIIGLVSNRS